MQQLTEDEAVSMTKLRVPRRSIILPGQKTQGWPKANKKLKELPTDALAKILETKWREDVHFVQYAVIEDIGAYRYNNEIFKSPEFEAHKQGGGGIDIIAVAFDVDSPAKKEKTPGALDFWFEAERPKILRLIAAHPGGLVWRTKGGWRGCWYHQRRIVSTDDTLIWRKDYLAAVVYLERAFGIIADSSCNDWNRLHRVPYGIRDTEANYRIGEPETRETIGRLEETQTFDLATAAADEDRQEAKRRFVSSWKSPANVKKGSRSSPADEIPSDLPLLLGQSVWERVLSSRGMIIRELAPGKLAVSCPNAHSHTTPGNETSTVLYAPGPGEVLGHPHCSHHHCQQLDWKTAVGVSDEEWGVLTREAISELPHEAEATNVAVEVPEAQDTPDAAERRVVAGLIPDATQGHKPAGIAANITHLLLHHPYWKGRLIYDNFRHERYWTEVPDLIRDIHKWDKKVLEADVAYIQGWLMRGNGLDQRPPISASLENVRVGITNACMANSFDSLIDHVKRLDGAWDGTERLETWLIDYMGADDTPLTRAISKRWLIASVARALKPGCVADMMPILEGDQEIGKNYMLDIMFGQDFLTVPYGEKFATKDFEQKCADTWCVHDDELASTRKAQLEVIKSWLTQRTAKFRKAFDRDFVTVPRRFIVVGSTNRKTYLEDSENRRFWPIYLRKLNDQGLIKARDQIWAEAIAYHNTNTEYRITKQDAHWAALSTIHEEKKYEDPLSEELTLQIRIGNLKVPFQMSHAIKVLGISIDKMNDSRLVAQVGKALHQMGYISRLIRNGGPPSRWWFVTGSLPPVTDFVTSQEPVRTDAKH